MTLIALPSRTVRIKNLIIVTMCLVFCVWFSYDGYYVYPTDNNRKVDAILQRNAAPPGTGNSFAEKAVSPEHIEQMTAWQKAGGWDGVTDEMHEQMDAAIRQEAGNGHVNAEGWKGPFDVKLQRRLALGLVACVVASIAWFIHCQRRRALAEGGTVSPARGVVIPWEKITRVDNTRWKSVGIVDITYTDEHGQSQKASFDDYKLQREPLLAILDQLSEMAVNAEFIPKQEEKPAEGSAAQPDAKEKTGQPDGDGAPGRS